MFFKTMQKIYPIGTKVGYRYRLDQPYQLGVIIGHQLGLYGERAYPGDNPESDHGKREDQTEPEPSAQNTETDDHDDDHRGKDQAHLQVALVNVILIHSGFPLRRRNGGLFC